MCLSKQTQEEAKFTYETFGITKERITELEPKVTEILARYFNQETTSCETLHAAIDLGANEGEKQFIAFHVGSVIG